MSVARNLTVICVALLLAACCPYDQREDAIAHAKSLCEARLAKLAHDVNALYGDVSFNPERGVAIPPQFRDIGAHSIRSFGSKVGFHLAGCMDDKIYLMVVRDNSPDRRRITLLDTGESRRDVLWPPRESAP